MTSPLFRKVPPPDSRMSGPLAEHLKYLAVAVNVLPRPHTTEQTGQFRNGQVVVLRSASTTTYSLPRAALADQQVVTIKRMGVGEVIVAPSAGEVIDDSSLYTLTPQYAAVTLQSTGTQWLAI